MLFKFFRYLIHLGGFLPLIWLIYTINFNFSTSFGSDPSKEIIHFLGYVALSFFLALFSFRIIVQLCHQTIFLPLHRSLGLWGLFWLVLHILSYLFLELGFNMPLFVNELITRTYLQLGGIAALIFIIIAISSIPIIKRRLKAYWFPLHKLTLIAIILSTIHYYLSLKTYNLDSIFFICLSILFVLWKLFHKKLTT
ncbi:ferric reductase-like transmembrane domain-containing protein [Gallibacterium trehalosifermentans]|uniref:Ferric reductase-like transmembrane domain-containing protein n=1 Tax=Gallibacterium trehalosifermentans TaxID=516935 RepID=A0ABV6H2G3_9PAST